MSVHRFCLRILLHHVPGPTSFADVRTYRGRTYDTFKEAAQMRGLLRDDAQWDRMLTEASTYQMGAQLRQLFVTLLTVNNPSNPHLLWETHRAALCDDLLRAAHAQVHLSQCQLSSPDVVHAELPIALQTRPATPLTDK